MSTHNAVRVHPSQDLWVAAKQAQVGYLDSYMRDKDPEVGTVLLEPTYRLEEVEKIVEPEKPGVPVEPYVGMVIPFESGAGHYVVCGNVAGEWCLLTFFSYGRNEVEFISNLPAYLLNEWPHTPSTPAVTRKVKKWVKIEHPEVPSDGLA